MDKITEGCYIIYGILLRCFCQFLGSVVICSIYQIWSLTILPIMLIFGIIIIKYYISASRDLTRMEGILKTPVLNLVTEVLPGTSIIRAYKYEKEYFNIYNSRVDELFKILLFKGGSECWFGITMDFVAYFFMLFLIIFAILFENQFTPQSIGLLLTYALQMQSSFFNFLGRLGNFINVMINMERCISFTKIESENYEENIGNKNDVNIEEWPSKGDVEFINYSVKYRPETDLVLKNLSFFVNGGEKIGIVGRTGSGKSTICLSLFRILEATEGKILIDGIDLSQIGLLRLRSKLTIIPQDPSLVKGTIRYNIDPLNLRNDEEIIEVMKSIKFWYLAENNEKGLYMMVNYIL